MVTQFGNKKKGGWAIKALKFTESEGLQVRDMHWRADGVDERQDAAESAARNLEKNLEKLKTFMQLLLLVFFYTVYKIGTR